MYSTCRMHFPALSSFMTCHRVCSQIRTTGATSGTGTATLPVHLSSPRVLVGFVLLNLQFYLHVLQIVVSTFVLFLLAIVLSNMFFFVLRIMSTSWYLQTLHIIAEEFTHLNYLELSKKDGCKIIYKYSPFHIDLAIKMAA